MTAAHAQRERKVETITKLFHGDKTLGYVRSREKVPETIGVACVHSYVYVCACVFVCECARLVCAMPCMAFIRAWWDVERGVQLIGIQPVFACHKLAEMVGIHF